MWETELKSFIKTIKWYDVSYQKILIKERLIKKILEYMYTNTVYSKAIFTWWTCLRIIFGISRLSEDIDIDIMDIKGFSPEQFREDLERFCKQTGGISDTVVSIKSQWRSFVIKLPLLKTLWYAKSSAESDYLYVKVDTSTSDNPYGNTKVTPYIKDAHNFFVRHYDLPSLFASKLWAIFGREVKTFHNEYKFKGRDLFDMIRYLQQGVQPNFKRLQYQLKEIGITITSMKDFVSMLDKKIASIDENWIYEDLRGLVENNFSARQFATHFKEIYTDLKKKFF
jgi:hypothetical protein